MYIDMLYYIVVCGLMMIIFYSWAIRSIYKNRTKFMSTDFDARAKRTPLMNRVSNLIPENEVIDVYWEYVDERGWKNHHKLNIIILILVGLYWFAKFIMWSFS